MNTRLNHLMAKYLDKQLTVAELEELQQLATSGRHDEALSAIIDGLLSSSEQEAMDPALRQKADTIFQAITKTKHKSFTITSRSIGTPLAIKFAVAASIALLAAIGIWLFLSSTGEMPFAPNSTAIRQLADAPTVAQSATYTGKQYLTLPDGTTVLMNENTELSYESGFGSETREIKLTGEAFFDVVQDKDHPFIITTGELKTTVLGTSFNIKAYEKEDIQVTVATGKVKLEATKNHDNITQHPNIPISQHSNTSTHQHINTTTLQANQQAIYHPKTQTITKIVDTPLPTLAWKDDFIIFHHLPMAEAVAMIEKQFGTPITIENDALRECNLNASFLREQGLEHILKVLCKLTKAEYVRDGGSVLIKGGQCE